MDRTLLTATDVAKRAGCSVHFLMGKLYNMDQYEKSIVNKRGRMSRKHKGVFKPFWWLNDTYYGMNIRNAHGGNQVKFFAERVDELLRAIGIGGVL